MMVRRLVGFERLSGTVASDRRDPNRDRLGLRTLDPDSTRHHLLRDLIDPPKIYTRGNLGFIKRLARNVRRATRPVRRVVQRVASVAGPASAVFGLPPIGGIAGNIVSATAAAQSAGLVGGGGVQYVDEHGHPQAPTQEQLEQWADQTRQHYQDMYGGEAERLKAEAYKLREELARAAAAPAPHRDGYHAAPSGDPTQQQDDDQNAMYIGGALMVMFALLITLVATRR